MLQLRIEDGKRLEEYRDGHWAKHWHVWEPFSEDYGLCGTCGALALVAFVETDFKVNPGDWKLMYGLYGSSVKASDA